MWRFQIFIYFLPVYYSQMYKMSIDIKYFVFTFFDIRYFIKIYCIHAVFPLTL